MTTLLDRLRRAVIGAPKSVKDPHAFHKLSLVALLAWVGLGADGLSSSSYGPGEAFRALVDDHGQFHTGLAVGLAAATALTVFIISHGQCQRHVPRPWNDGSALDLRPRLLDGRRHLHRDRDRLQRAPDDARAARPDRQADDGADGHVAGDHRRWDPALLSARRPHTRSPARQDPQRAPAGAGREQLVNRGVPLRARVRRHGAAERGIAALRRGAGRLPRRAARDGHHGHRLVASPPLLGALRAADHAQRRAPDEPRRGARAGLHAGQRGAPRRHVFDQRLPDVLALEPRHDGLLGPAAQGRSDVVGVTSPRTCSRACSA